LSSLPEIFFVFAQSKDLSVPGNKPQIEKDLLSCRGIAYCTRRLPQLHVDQAALPSPSSFQMKCKKRKQEHTLSMLTTAKHLRVVTVATHTDGYFETLVFSCKKHDLPLYVLGWGEKWEGYVWKIQKFYKYLQDLPEAKNEIIVFVDGHDVVALEHHDIILHKFLEEGTDILLSLDHPQPNQFYRFFYERLFQPYEGSYLNSGLYMGYRNALLDFCTSICTINDCSKQAASQDDQQYLANACRRKKEVKFKWKMKVNATRNVFFNYVSTSERDNPKTFSLDDPECVRSRQFGTSISFVHGVLQTDLDFILNHLKYPVPPSSQQNKLSRSIAYGSRVVKHYSKYFMREILYCACISSLLCGSYITMWYSV
jgi:hypothetical protein